MPQSDYKLSLFRVRNLPTTSNLVSEGITRLIKEEARYEPLRIAIRICSPLAQPPYPRNQNKHQYKLENQIDS